MGELSEIRVGAVRRLIEQVPDSAIHTLETALGSGRQAGPMAVVQDIVASELASRRARSAVFAPLLPVCAPPPDDLQRLTFPKQALSMAWTGLRLVEPETAELAIRTVATLRPEDEPHPVFDELAVRAANGLRDREPAFASLAGLLGPRTDAFVQLLALTPLVRAALGRLPVWLRTLSNEHAAGIRLAFRDATAVAEDAGPPFIEILLAHIDEPWQVLRLISLVMDRPGDRYLASSELASFGERLMADLDRRIEEVRRFDPTRGLEGGVALAGSVFVATAIINEFEQWLAINREGPWGSRLTSIKRALALAVEARLREIESAVVQALPVRPSGRGTRGAPKLGGDPDPVAVARAQALLGFLYESRTSASYGGFGAVRAKVVEALDPKIDQYAEDLLESLHAGEGDPERTRAFLEITAEFLGLIRDPKAAEIVRRRTAVA
jgi:hypothetical protein